MDLASVLIGGAFVLAGLVLTHRLTVCRDSRTARIALSHKAAEDVLAALRPLRDLVRDSEWRAVSPGEWATASCSFDEVWDNNRHRFPQKWQYLQFNVRSAIGEHAGGVVAVRDDRRMGVFPSPPFNRVWHRNALEYAEMVIDRLQGWQDAPSLRPNHHERLMTFDEWLAFRS